MENPRTHLKSCQAIPFPFFAPLPPDTPPPFPTSPPEESGGEGSKSSAPPHNLASGLSSLTRLNSSSSYNLRNLSARSGLSAEIVSWPGSFMRFNSAKVGEAEDEDMEGLVVVVVVVVGGQSGHSGREDHRARNFWARVEGPSVVRNWARVGRGSVMVCEEEEEEEEKEEEVEEDEDEDIAFTIDYRSSRVDEISVLYAFKGGSKVCNRRRRYQFSICGGERYTLDVGPVLTVKMACHHRMGGTSGLGIK